MNSKWDKRFLDLAYKISEWSKDPSTKVGAIIVDNDRRVVSLGYNGFPRGVDDSIDKYNDRALKNLITVHAERNAILNSQTRPSGCTIYITHPPCAQCAGSIIQSGIVRVVCPSSSVDDSTVNMLDASTSFNERWAQSIDQAKIQLKQACISFEAVSYDND